MNIVSEYKPNSHVYKEEQKKALEERKKAEKVVSGPVKLKKKSGITKLTDNIIAEDAKNVKTYILTDVLLPGIKKAIFDIVTGGIEMLIYGTTGKHKGGSLGSKVSYRNYYDHDRRDDRSDDSRSRNRFDIDEMIFTSRGEASAVKDQLEDMLAKYGVVTVADLYDSIDETAPYTSNRYGWTNLRNAEVTRVRDGYLLKLPKPSPID
jgi:hypothetical protein